jgi:hypothetical protein
VPREVPGSEPFRNVPQASAVLCRAYTESPRKPGRCAKRPKPLALTAVRSRGKFNQVGGRPLGGRGRSLGSRGHPLGTRGRPLETRGGPLGIRGRPLGIRGGPLGIRGRPLGIRGRPLGIRGGPLGIRGGPVGSRGRPLGSRGHPLGNDRHPLGSDGGSSISDDLPTVSVTTCAGPLRQSTATSPPCRIARLRKCSGHRSCSRGRARACDHRAGKALTLFSRPLAGALRGLGSCVASCSVISRSEAEMPSPLLFFSQGVF